MGEFVKVAQVSDIAEGTCVRAVVKGQAIAVFNLAGSLHAIGDTCTHAEASLCEGHIDGEEIICPLHFATFRIRTGQCTGPPADEDVPSYPVRVNENGDVEVEV